MKVAVEFLSAERQKASVSDPLQIAIWRLGPINEFPYYALITEKHDVGMSVSTGIRLYRKHKREVWITSEQGGIVLACPDRRCWDPRRRGSKLSITEKVQERRGSWLTLIEEVP